jgi:UDP-N-acetylmuramoyl-tripeptide--D-alanyl-D-alanine ligase
MLHNDAGFNYIDLLNLFNPSSLVNINKEWICSGVSTDSRTISEGDLFVALIGEQSDGHENVPSAFLNGATGAIVLKEWYLQNHQIVEDMPLVLVDDTLEALGLIARYHRRKFDIPVVAIGGSNGKTTTKDIAAHLLESKFNILKTYGNYNNRIGVPLMLLQLNYEHQAAILEIGTNEPGEIYILSNIVEPSHGLITNIGREHLEKLIDLDGVEQEEVYLFGFLNKHSRRCLINMDDERLRKYISIIDEKFRFATHTVNQQDDFELMTELTLNDNLNPIIKFSYQGIDYRAQMKTSGISTGLNAVAAMAVAIELGMTPGEIIPKLESFEFTRSRGYGRMLIDKFANVLLINDCYNANPDSMESALKTLNQSIVPGKKYSALGDMLELGEVSLNEHKGVLQKAINVSGLVFLFGKTFEKAYLELGKPMNVKHFTDKQTMITEIFDIVKAGDSLLIKGSRGMRMEEIVDSFYKKFS